MKILQMNSVLLDKLNQPAVSNDGYSDAVVDETVEETLSFPGSIGDADSYINITRTVEYNAARDVLTATVYSVSNAPVITSATTDAADNSEIPVDTTVEIAIEGEYFGADVGDVQAYLVIPFREGVRGSALSREGIKVHCAILASANLDTDTATMTVSAYLSLSDRFKPVRPGVAKLHICNTKRNMESSPVELDVVL